MNVFKLLIVLVHFIKVCNSLWNCNSFCFPFKGETEVKTEKKVVMDLSNCTISMDWLYVDLITKPGVYEIELEAVGTYYYYHFDNYPTGRSYPELKDVIHKLYNREYFQDFKKDATIDDSKINIYGTLHKKRHYKMYVGNHHKFPTNSLLFQRKATCLPVGYYYYYKGNSDEKLTNEYFMTYSLVVEPIIRIPNKKCKPIARFEKLRLADYDEKDFDQTNATDYIGGGLLGITFEYGVEINGTTLFLYPKSNSTMELVLLSHLKSLVNIEEIDTTNLFKPIPYNWKQDFEWRIIGKNKINYHGAAHYGSEAKVVIYQLVADCDNLILHTKYLVEAIYEDGECLESLVPAFVHDARANCSLIKSKLPDVTNCEPIDFYKHVFDERNYEYHGYKPKESVEYTINIGVTWNGRPEYVNYEEDFKNNEIGNKLWKILKQKLQKSKLTRFDWSTIKETTNLVLMTKETTEEKEETKIKHDHRLLLAQLGVICGEYLIYMPIVHKYERNRNGHCTEGEFGLNCNEKFENGTIFWPHICEYNKYLGKLDCSSYAIW